MLIEDIVIIGLLALSAALLLACWMVLRFIAKEIEELSATVHRFLYDYENLNNFEGRKKLMAEVAVDRDFAEWQSRQPKESEPAP
jgi:hypothetical protein